MALAKINRLNLRLHRKQVEENCKKLHSPLFTYLISPQPKLEGTQPSTSRFAILLSKKLAKKAVARNKIKRRISQSLQDSLSSLPKNLDVILIPKPSILNKSILEIQTDLLKLLTNIRHSEERRI